MPAGDILEFSRLDFGSVVLDSAPLSLRRTLEACVDIVSQDAAAKGLQVRRTSICRLHRSAQGWAARVARLDTLPIAALSALAVQQHARLAPMPC